MLNNTHKKIVLIITVLAMMLTGSVCFAQDFDEQMTPGFLKAPINSAEQDKNETKKEGFWKKKKQEEKPEIEIISDYMDYYPEEDKVVATGNAYVIPEDKLSKLKADKITFFRETNELVAEGNVKLLKNGNTVYGSFMRVDLNKNSALLQNPSTQFHKIKLVAKEGRAEGDDLELIKGRAKIPDNMKFLLSTNSMYSGLEQSDRKSFLTHANTPEFKQKSQDKSFQIKAKEIVLESGLERNIVVMKGATLYKNRLKVASIPKLVISGDKNFSEIDTTMPEIGYIRQLGFHMGPAWLVNGPLSSTIKLSPLFVSENGKAGIGGMARIKNDKNRMELFYGTPNAKVILQGSHEFNDPRVKFNYGSNAFVDDWFMGRKLPNKFSEIEYKDAKTIDDLGLNYKYRYSLGYASDYEIGNSQDWRMNSYNAMRALPRHKDDWGTLRLKTQGEFTLQEPIWSKDDNDINLNASTQYDLTQYGTGQNMGIIRFGPTFMYAPAASKFKFNGAYFMSGLYGESPFTWDQFYYGKQSVNVAYEYKFTKKFTMGYGHTLNLLKDNFDNRLLAENRLFIKYGPEDFKFSFAYDTVRKRTFMGLDMLVGSEQSDIEFNKLKIKEYKKLKKQQDTKNSDIQKNKIKQQKKEEQV